LKLQCVSGLICLFFSITAAAAEPVSLELEQGWIRQAEGPWQMRHDHRDLLVMRHPWTPSKTGAFASLSRKVAVPADWTGEPNLSFYCSDDYNTDDWRPDGSWLTAEGFIGHRMKQVLVDDRVVWSVDVSDPVVQGQSPYYVIPLGVKPGQEFLLTLLAFDAVESATSLPDDFYQSANNEIAREADPDAANFMTHVYWGDVFLTPGGVEPIRGRRPVEKRVRAVHADRWPLPPFGEAQHPEDPVKLELSAPAGLPEQGFPVRFGVPIHQGRAHALREDICLTQPSGHSLYSQKTITSTWPDGSVRWALVDFTAKPEMTHVDLRFEHGRAMRPAAAKVREREGEITLDSGVISFDWLQGRLLSDVALHGRTKISDLAMFLKVDGEEVEAVSESAEIAEAGPYRTTLAVDGKFSLLERTFGSYRFETTVFAKLPYVKMVLRIYSDTLENLPVSGLQLRARLPEEPGEITFPDAAEPPAPQPAQPPEVLRQISETERELNSAPVDAAAPAYVAWDGGVLTVRQFRELFPKVLSISADTVAADLVAADGEPVVFTPGEAKTHEIWLAFGDVDPKLFAGAVDKPPVLQNPEYYCSTGAFGPAAPYEGVPALCDHMTGLEKTWEAFGQKFGVRHFPDGHYQGGSPKWCNNYYERMLGLWSEWFISGDRAWFDLASDVCRHIMDVAVVHSEVPGHDWLGAVHGPGDNHVAGPWNPTMRIAGLAAFHKLTGDHEALQNALDAAQFCVREKRGLDSPSVRDHAGPFDAICTAYDETGGIELLDEGAARVEAALQRIDIRRGVWAETHGSMVYRGNIPWMVAQLARPLYLWYRHTGDVKAAQVLVGLAESIICENTDWEAPGHVYGYSHNPHFKITAAYDLLIVPVIFAAYELTEDPFFLEAARRQWERWQQSGQFDSPLNCHWNTPWLVHYLKK